MIGMLCCSHWPIFVFFLTFAPSARRIFVPSSIVNVWSGSIDFVLEKLLVLFQWSPFIANDVERAVLVESQPDALFVLNSAQIHVDKDPIMLSDEFWAQAGRGDTPRVERTHRQLRSRFTDRLSSDNPYSFPCCQRGCRLPG